MRARVYLILALIGLVTPPALLVVYLADHSVGDLFEAGADNLVAIAVFSDVAISALVFFYWSFGESRRLGMGNWWPYVPATVFIGLCFAFPLFLYKRERALEAGASPA